MERTSGDGWIEFFFFSIMRFSYLVYVFVRRFCTQDDWVWTRKRASGTELASEEKLGRVHDYIVG